jgi:hypothetical protein
MRSGIEVGIEGGRRPRLLIQLFRGLKLKGRSDKIPNNGEDDTVNNVGSIIKESVGFDDSVRIRRTQNSTFVDFFSIIKKIVQQQQVDRDCLLWR